MIYILRKRKLLLVLILSFCIPLNVLAGKSLSGHVSGQTSDPVNDQLGKNEEDIDTKKEEIADPNKTPEEQEQANQNLNNLQQQTDTVQDILNHDATTGEASQGSTSTSTIDPGTHSNAVAGFIGGTSGSEAVTLRMGLAKLSNESFPLNTDFDSLDTAIQNYGAKYYVACEGGALYYPSNKGCNTNNRGSLATTAPSGSISASILQCLYDDTTGEYVSSRGSGTKFIDLDEKELDQLMEELSQIDSYNMALYQEWKTGSASNNPIVAVVEVAGLTINGTHKRDSSNLAWVSVADCAYEIGDASAYETFLSSDLTKYANTPVRSNTEGGQVTSNSDAAIMDICGFAGGLPGNNGGHNWWPYFYTKHMFGTWWPTGGAADHTILGGAQPQLHATAWSIWAYKLKQTKSENPGIHGCTMFALRPNTGGIEGTFDWHIDAEGLPLATSGHAEDSVVDDTGGSSTKQCTVGSVSLYNENWQDWAWYMDENKISEVTLSVKTFHRGQQSFTVDVNKIKGSSNSEGVVSSDRVLAAEVTLSSQDFINKLKSKDLAFPVVSNDVLGVKAEDLRVAYAMTIDVKMGEETFTLENNDVHWAIYGTDDGRTFKFQQVAGDAYAQVKQGDLDGETYEAMAGTPTTEDLFITMGGEQYVVNMQFRYVVDDYIRRYVVEVPETPNLTYYQSGEAESEAGDSKDVTREDDSPAGDFDPDPADEYNDACDRDFKAAAEEIRKELRALAIDTNKDTYAKYYTACEDTTAGVVSYFNSFIDGLNADSHSQDSPELVLLEGTDPDTGEEFRISVYLAFHTERTAPAPTHGHTGAYQSWINSEPSADDFKDGYDFQQAHGAWQDSEPSPKYRHHYDWSESYRFELVYQYGGDAVLSKECRSNPKMIGESVTMEQVFENVKYLDILDCHVWQLAEGRETGIGRLLAAPISTETEVLKLAVEEMGYVYYDSEQTQDRGWEEGKLQWRCVDANDLEATGRLVNSYNSGKLPLTEGDYFNGDEHALKVLRLGDTITFEYDMAVQGGRSSRSQYKFLAQAAAHTFYESPSKPYKNTILCASDILALYAGDAGAADWLSFAAFEFDSSGYTGTEGLEQYIMSPDSDLIHYVDTAYVIDGRNQDASQGTGVKPILSQECTYLDGFVDLEKEQEYSEYNRETLCMENPFTFVDGINETNDMPRVGYRGDWLTTDESHMPRNYTKGQGFQPDAWSALNGAMDEWKAGVTDTAHSKVIELLGPVAEAYPHITGLNVNRTQPNNTYKTGYAGLLYRKVISRECSVVPGVMTVCMYDGYRTSGSRSLVDTGTYPNGMFLEANYDDLWESINDIVIFNPSTAENTYVFNLSEYLPDAQNTEGTDYETNPVRDQRVNGYYVGGGPAENVMTGAGEVVSGISDFITSVDYKLKTVSEAPTSYYTASDYVTNAGAETAAWEAEAGTLYHIPASGTYRLTLFDSLSNSTTVSRYFDKGDILYNDGTAVYLKARTDEIAFDDLVSSERLPADTTEISMKKGASLHFDLSGLGVLKKGEVIHLAMSMSDRFNASAPPVDVYVNEERADMAAAKYVTSADGYLWDYYLELGSDITISDLEVIAADDTRLMKNSEPLVRFEDTFLMDVGRAYSDPAYPSSTIKHGYDPNDPSYVRGSNARSYNHLYTDYTLESGLETGMRTAGKLYITSSVNSTLFAIKADALANPHKVLNRNWRYYVIGWRTSNGSVISSPDDPLLYMDKTSLKWPNGVGSVTVAELKSSACLVKYNGTPYLTTTEFGRRHYIGQTGSTVTSYDTFCLSSAASTVTLAGEPAAYPLQSGLSGDIWKDNKYEFFFKLADTDGYLYDTSRATNAVYRFSPSDASYDLNLSKQNWEYDWEAVTSSIQTNVSAIENGGLAHYISLDDEFSIHYDNLGNYAQTDAHNIGAVSNQLGMGWTNNMDTSKWIYQKWVQFDIDVFLFDRVDPSIDYVNRTGLYFYPAGSIIPLGYYEGDSGEADNEGHWVDYGKDNGYNYHFWAALSTGEVREADICFATLNINATGAGANTGNQESNNKNVPSPAYRYANARRHFYSDVVGRVGGLTMIDTGDYRWSNTFKTVEDDAEWAIYGLIRKILEYSNIFGTPSTQKMLVTDPFDVRGRIGLTSMLHTDKEYSIYEHNPESMNTYGTQWHKESDKTKLNPLPLRASYNDLDALAMTEQKLGYQSLMTLETIGNYYGNSLDESADGVDPVNLNDDHGDQKAQIRPVYIALTYDDAGNLINSRPVDVHMKNGATYKKINSGSADTNTVLKSLYSNIYLTYMTTNTGDYHALDQNLLRRMVTVDEAAITGGLLTKYDTDTTSLVTPVKDNSLTADLSPTYTYGNGQYLFLRERNRNFVGKSSQALGGQDTGALADYGNAYDRYNMNAQKYYFDIGLPSSAIFVEVDGDPTKDVVNAENTFILTALEVYVRGEVWMLSYKSPVSEMNIKVNGETNSLTPDQWNPIRDTSQWLIPVTFYDMEEGSSKDDLNTTGTH